MFSFAISGEILDEIGAGEGGGELQIGGESDGGVPAVRDEAHAVLLRHPGDAALFADAADLGHIGLDDVERARLEPGLERLPAREHLAAGDRHGRMLAQLHVVLERVGIERLLEPVHVVVGEHLRGVERPLVAVRPEGIAAAGIDHQARVRADGLARGPDDRLIRGGIAPAERPPADLERAEALRLHREQVIAQLRRLVHQQRGVGLHALAVASAEQPADRLARRLARADPTARCRCR